jgi:hypothetical protein
LPDSIIEDIESYKNVCEYFSNPNDNSDNESIASNSIASKFDVVNGFLIETIDKPAEKEVLSGRRIIEVDFFINSIKKLNNHGIWLYY